MTIGATVSSPMSSAIQTPAARVSGFALAEGVPATNLKALTSSGTGSQFLQRPTLRAPMFDPEAMLAALQGLGADDFASNQPFAEVYKNGQLVARIDNGGGATTYGAAQGIITGNNEPYSGGPELAQWRANKIASAIGGTVKIADTAQTQAEWKASYATERARVDEAMAPYRAAMAAYRAQIAELTAPVPVQTARAATA